MIGERMTVEEMSQKYPNEWLFISKRWKQRQIVNP